jgi:chloramphenicol-sensitive protein RarD
MEDRDEQTSRVRAGLAYGLAAHACWGVMPLYFHFLNRAEVLASEQLAHRILWSAVLLSAALTLLHKWGELASALAQPRARYLLLAGTAFIAVNWYAFLYGLATKRALQNSLGYFTNPLFNVALGVLILRERLRPYQWVALAIAGCGIVYFAARLGEPPWIALTVASTFACYGLMRKLAGVDGLVGLTAETLALAPASAAALAWLMARGESGMFRHGLGVDLLLIFSGLATVVPLWLFVLAARRLRLSTLGFLQYIGPSLQFLLALTVLGESLAPGQMVAFALIWAALALFTVGSILDRPSRPGEPGPSAPGVIVDTPTSGLNGVQLRDRDRAEQDHRQPRRQGGG